MAASLVNDGCPNKRCSISLKAITSRSENVIKMSDGQCYYTSYISRYVKLLLRNYQIGHRNFVLPTRSPIQQSDLNKLYITPTEIQSIKDEWHASAEYQAIQAERMQQDADMAADMEDESDDESIASTVDQVRNNPEINTVIRWGVQLSHLEEEEIPLAIIHRIDRFLMPPGHVPSEELEEDEIIQDGRKRPLGRNEYDFLYRGEMPPPNTQLGIRIESTGEIVNTLEEYVYNMNANGHRLEIENVRGTPIAGGRKTKRNPKHHKGGRSSRRKSRRKGSRRRKNKMI